MNVTVTLQALPTKQTDTNPQKYEITLYAKGYDYETRQLYKKINKILSKKESKNE